MHMTSSSTGSTKKYESNQFLKLLGLDLTNLAPDNIKVDIEQAYEFIKRWKVSSKDEIKKIIRYKVVNEIMNVEERRSVQKLAKTNKKMKIYMDKTTHRALIEKKKKEDFLVFSQTNYETKDVTTNNDVHTNVLSTKENKTTQSSHVVEKNAKVQTTIVNNTVTNTPPNKEINKVQTTVVSNTVNNTHPNKGIVSPKEKSVKENKESKENQGKSRSKSKSKFHSYTINLKKDEPKKMKKILYSSYNNADRILRYIDNKDSLKENEPLVRHFNTFKYTKKFDDVTNSILKTQQLTLCSEADYGNINLVTDVQMN